MSKRPQVGLDEHQKQFVKLIEQNSHRHRKHEVFSDFCELAAITLSNAVDLLQYETREARYLQIVKTYTKEEVDRFPAMLASVVNSLEVGFNDCLGQLFMALELGDHWKGQYFTPYEVCRMMSMMTLTDATSIIERKSFIMINEPAVGAGAMVIACANTLHDQKINFQMHMHVVAQDIDITAVHMAYIQLSLLHIPAVVVHGNSLSCESWSHWKTPAHIIGMWDSKLNRSEQAEKTEISIIDDEYFARNSMNEQDSVSPQIQEDQAPEMPARREAAAQVRQEEKEQYDLFT